MESRTKNKRKKTSLCAWNKNLKKENLPFFHSPLLWWSDDDDSNKGEMSAKKRRVETFQQKEKRKRDMGQATSDKNFVEEEKRILRQKIEWGISCQKQRVFFLFQLLKVTEVIQSLIVTVFMFTVLLIFKTSIAEQDSTWTCVFALTMYVIWQRNSFSFLR